MWRKFKYEVTGPEDVRDDSFHEAPGPRRALSRREFRVWRRTVAARKKKKKKKKTRSEIL